MSKEIELAILALACWRLSHLLALEDGPWRLFERIRKLAGQRIGAEGTPYNTTHLAEGVTCMWCNSVWIGTVLTILWGICGKIAVMIALPFALSACAVAIDSGIEALLRGIREWQ